MERLRKGGLWSFVFVAGIGLGAAAMTWSQGTRLAVPDNTAAESRPQGQSNDLSVAFRHVSEQALPAVVWIETIAEQPEIADAGDGEATPDGGNALPEGIPQSQEDMLRRFFGNDPRLDDLFRMPSQPDVLPPMEGRGSGFVIDPEGIIMTNAHVVDGATRLIVHMYDGSELRAESWAVDKSSDVAIVRVKADHALPALKLGNSDQMAVGDWVLAMGDPFDVGVTVTAGIVSATGRGPGINQRESFIQTDAAINPGNSGGPLINLDGEVIGINTAISTRSGGYDGVGFAIPSNMATWVANQLIEDGAVSRAYLGVALQEMTNKDRQAFGVGLNQGALVSNVQANTPAAKAGVREGDIILEFAGEKVANRTALQGIVERQTAGETYQAVVLRGGERITLDITLEKMPADFAAGSPQMMLPQRGGTAKPEGTKFDALGLEAQTLSGELRKQLGLDEDAQGVLITEVDRGGLAAKEGLRAGDVIEQVGSTDVTDVESFDAAIKEGTLEDGIPLLVMRGGASQFVVLKSE